MFTALARSSRCAARQDELVSTRLLGWSSCSVRHRHQPDSPNVRRSFLRPT
ncbi:hypothetical protein PybrP1_000493 [[Pythium] brassicae (nom. inval.)]|nr:hypothetical protein PybrP1_000493 [[Pythium] brassicae (nom. inval.)]